MTKKIAISVPDDVADRLSQESNVSAYITDAVRRRMDGERSLEMMRAAGVTITDEGRARARAERERLEASITPELQDKAEQIRVLIIAARNGTSTLRGDALIERIQQISRGDIGEAAA
jgi:hypothetical protein